MKTASRRSIPGIPGATALRPAARRAADARPVPGYLAGIVLIAALALSAAAADLVLPARSRTQTKSGGWQLNADTLNWEAHQTAIVVCDMWDRHWCRGATARVAEMAPRMNALLKAARAKGVFIIHCPSDTMGFYQDHPARRRAIAAPVAATTIPLEGWCHLDPGKEPPLPVDDSDGGCDCTPPCKTRRAWTRQIAALEILDQDAVTDSAEAYHLMRARGITNVMVLGVHTNMCVLGRPFSIRQMCKQGLDVVLVRDLTDAMYNPRAAPYVDHFRGTGLVIEHIEKHWCPTITSAAILGGEPFRFRGDQPPKVVLLIGEDEYRTSETLPVFAREFVAWRGMQTVVIQQNPGNKHDFPGLAAAMDDAGLLVLSVRRRALSPQNLQLIRQHLGAGRPLVGIRTASHAFAPRGTDADHGASWPGFDPEVLGGNYTGHHGPTAPTTVSLPANHPPHPILHGVQLDELSGSGSLYKTGPLVTKARPVLLGSIPGQAAESVAWTHRYGPNKARVFYSSFGHPDDFANPQFRRLLLNGILWALDRSIPADDRLQPH